RVTGSSAWLGRRSRPTTVTSPTGGSGTSGCTIAPAPAGGGTQPRLTRTAGPSVSTSGTSTSKPTRPLTERLRTSTVFAVSYRPVTVTRVHSASPDGGGPTVPGSPPGRGSACGSSTGTA